MLVENQYAKVGTHHPSFSISIRQCLITQKKIRVWVRSVLFWYIIAGIFLKKIARWMYPGCAHTPRGFDGPHKKGNISKEGGPFI